MPVRKHWLFIYLSLYENIGRVSTCVYTQTLVRFLSVSQYKHWSGLCLYLYANISRVGGCVCTHTLTGFMPKSVCEQWFRHLPMRISRIYACVIKLLSEGHAFYAIFL